jgi:hypothetical protein
VTQPPAKPGFVPFAPLNRFSHIGQLADATYRDGGSPNNDTLYSMAWLDVGREPIVLSHPDMGDRYFVFELASLDSDNFAYVGKRTTGGAAGSYAIVGPGWDGALPNGVAALPPSRTPTAVIFGRTLVDGPADVPTVRALQEQYTLVPLGRSGTPDAAAPDRRDVWAPTDPRTDPLGDWKTMNRAMTEEPPEARHAPLLKYFATVGIGPNQDVAAVDEATRRGLARAAQEGRALLAGLMDAGGASKRVNGWKYPPPTMGRAGLADDFVTRGALQCFGGIIANDPEEAVYLFVSADADGQPLSGEHRYELRFPPGQLPKVNAFWSLTLYGQDTNFVANPLDRYSLGDRTRGVKPDADGGLTIDVQHESPGAEREPNWLPAPTDTFYMVLRAYMPAEEIVRQTWAPPPVTRT